MTETYDDPPRLINCRYLSSDESHDILLVMSLSDGSETKVLLNPKEASDLVAKVIYRGREQFLRHGKALGKIAPKEATPIPIDHLEAGRGQNPGEAILWLTVGQLKMAMTVDLRSLTGLCEWVAVSLGSSAPSVETPRQ
jgi:hypothetical protein